MCRKLRSWKLYAFNMPLPSSSWCHPSKLPTPRIHRRPGSQSQGQIYRRTETSSWNWHQRMSSCQSQSCMYLASLPLSSWCWDENPTSVSYNITLVLSQEIRSGVQFRAPEPCSHTEQQFTRGAVPDPSRAVHPWSANRPMNCLMSTVLIGLGTRSLPCRVALPGPIKICVCTCDRSQIGQ